MKYCEFVYKTLRRKTREVMVGSVGVGGNNPVRIQSMTTSSTRDVEATLEQIMRLADSGCEIARVTVQGMKEANACEEIKNGLLQRGYEIPLVADIHFYPPAAMKVCEFVDKVRINPGNFADRRATFKVLEYDDVSYAKEIERIEEKFTPLVLKCKKLKRAMRIGTNHGSLSDRIMNRFGDTPKGMVESTLEYARICRQNNYHDFMFSMKSSNPQVMIQAYRLLAARMYELEWDYPLHLGVTEAGEGEDGRVKSAIGIGSLLLDGLGDTIRVSLTEDPWHEIDPCSQLIRFAEIYQGKGIPPFEEKHRDIMQIVRRPVDLPKHVSMQRDGTVILKMSCGAANDPSFYEKIGCSVAQGKPKLTPMSADNLIFDQTPETAKDLKEAGVGILQPVSIREHELRRFAPQLGEGFRDVIYVEKDDKNQWQSLKTIKPAMILLRPIENRLHVCRKFFDWLQDSDLRIPVILNFSYDCLKEDLIIRSAAECGSFFCDGLGDGLCLEGPYDPAFLRLLSFNILQSARMRMIKTDFISCPSCGRTLFNLQDVTKRIRKRTAHLPGVKIAIMGCIVNGPGEMADADFGYVGSKPEKIDLYVGKTCVERNIDFEDADDRLVDLIKAHDRWVEPTTHQTPHSPIL